MLRPEQKLAIYMDGAIYGYGGKMGFGILRYSPNPIACVIDSESAGRNAAQVTGIPRPCPIVSTVEEAMQLGAEVFVLGIAPPGGQIPQSWYGVIDRAVAGGLSVVNGLHDLLGGRYPDLRLGQWVWDIRIEPAGLGPATGEAAQLSNQRVLLIGTDMAVGKMTAGLEIHRVARGRGIDARFVATGQIGITITGAGVPLDAVRVDFAGGAIQREVLANADAPMVIVEGQGSLVHPGSTANLPLLRGAMPTDLVLCHRAGQTHLYNLPKIAIPPLSEFIRLYEDLGSACGTFARPRTAGVCLNTFHIESDHEALAACRTLELELNMPVVDPVRHGPDRILEALMGAL